MVHRHACGAPIEHFSKPFTGALLVAGSIQFWSCDICRSWEMTMHLTHWYCYYEYGELMHKTWTVISASSVFVSSEPYIYMYVRVFMAFITATVLCTRFQDSLQSVPVRKVHVVLATAGFKCGRKPCTKTLETVRRPVVNCRKWHYLYYGD